MASDDSFNDSLGLEEWADDIYLCKALAKSKIICVTNYTKKQCDIIFELVEPDNKAVELINISIDRNNRCSEEKAVVSILSPKQIEIKRLERYAFIRGFLTGHYMSGIHRFVKDEGIHRRRLSSYIINSSQLV